MPQTAGKNTQDPAQNKGSGEHWLRPVMRAIASEPRRSLAIRALPLPDSVVLAGKLGVFPGYSAGVPILRRILYRLPAVAVGAPTGQKIDNRSIANLLSNLLRSICGSKLAHCSRQVSPFISTA